MVFEGGKKGIQSPPPSLLLFAPDICWRLFFILIFLNEVSLPFFYLKRKEESVCMDYHFKVKCIFERRRLVKF